MLYKNNYLWIASAASYLLNGLCDLYLKPVIALPFDLYRFEYKKNKLLKLSGRVGHYLLQTVIRICSDFFEN